MNRKKTVKKMPPRRDTPRDLAERQSNSSRGKASRADPAEFGKKTSERRERMAKAIVETSPDERLIQGR